MSVNSEQITTATSGEVVQLSTGESYTVKDKCSINNGHWYCVTHQLMMPNEFDKTAHTFDSEHRMAWFCKEHNEIEAP